MKRIFSLAGLLASTVLIAACSGVLKSELPAQQTYLLEPLSAPVARTPGEPTASLAISVRAVPGLDTDRIQAVNTDSRLNPYANARWADHLPEVLASVLRRSMLASEEFGSVSANAPAEQGDWMLELEIQQFYGVLNSAGTTTKIAAEIESALHCKDQQHRVILSSEVAVHEERLSVVVKAHQQALDDISRKLLEEIRTICH